MRRWRDPRRVLVLCGVTVAGRSEAWGPGRRPSCWRWWRSRRCAASRLAHAVSSLGARSGALQGVITPSGDSTRLQAGTADRADRIQRNSAALHALPHLARPCIAATSPCSAGGRPQGGGSPNSRRPARLPGSSTAPHPPHPPSSDGQPCPTSAQERRTAGRSWRPRRRWRRRPAPSAAARLAGGARPLQHPRQRPQPQ